MSSLLERRIASIDQRLVVLAPPDASVSPVFGNVEDDPAAHGTLLHEMQRLRGAVYQRDGAVSAEDLVDGRHQTPEDEKSWHILLLDAERRVDACIWYLEHPNTIPVEGLRVRDCPLTKADDSRAHLHAAVRTELLQAQHEGVSYAEVGGWAVSSRSRCTPEGLLLILSTFGVSRAMGGALGLATATIRHSSSAILRRLGLSPLEAAGLPATSYFDPRYNCDMELLRFDTRRASARYDGMVERLMARLADVKVLTPDVSVASTTDGFLAVAAA